MSAKQMPVMKEQCATCPFREGVPEEYAELAPFLAGRSLTEASHICHSTGKENAFHEDTGRPERLCRGARNLQLAFFAAIGYIAAPTDEAWAAKCRELGIQQDRAERPWNT